MMNVALISDVYRDSLMKLRNELLETDLSALQPGAVVLTQLIKDLDLLSKTERAQEALDIHT